MLIVKTHEMIKDFEAGGFSKEQAEAIVDWQTRILAATALRKEDLKLFKVDLKEFERTFTFHLVVAHITGTILTVVLFGLLLGSSLL